MMIKLPRSLALVAVLLALNAFTSVAGYKVAVVEFYPDQVSFPSVRIQNNLNGLRNTLETVDDWNDVRIVVFPEYAILGEEFYTRESIAPFLESIPDVWIPGDHRSCRNSFYANRPILRQLSCIAKSYDVLLVANMGDIQPCEAKPCPSDGKFYYNTNVVFNTDGTIIAKYHKVNLNHRERKLFNPGTNPNTTCVSVYTDTLFGTFTCDDLLFKEPANCLLTKQHVSNFVLTGSCGNQFPFLMSTAVAQGWSKKHNVGLVVANQHFSTTHGTGSGVYNLGKSTSYMMSGEDWPMGTGKVIIGDVMHYEPVENNGNIADVGDIKVLASTHLNYTRLQNYKGHVEIEYKDNTSSNLSLKCNLEYYYIDSSFIGQYALGAYIGPSKSDDNFYYAVCTLVKCPLSGHCGEPVEGYKVGKAFYGEVVLNGTFASGSDVHATALGDGLRLLWGETLDIGTNNVTIQLVPPLLALSLWSRVDVG